jgi:4-nitrophenyl phosphatase
MKKTILERLKSAKGFVFDMDGTLVLGNRLNRGLQPLPGAVEFTRHLIKLGIPYVILTNGTVRTPKEYVPKLRNIGFTIDEQTMMTPSSVAADYLTRKKFKRVMVLGCEGVWRPLHEAGIEVILPSAENPGPVDGVYVGWYREFTIEDLEAACQMIWQGAKLFTASLAPFFATAHGRALGTSCAIAAMITGVTGRRAKVLGKPALEALRCASRILGVDTQNIAVVGDDPALEVPMAHKGGAMAIAVNTGIGADQDYAHLQEHLQPHLIVQSVGELLELFNNARH